MQDDSEAKNRHDLTPWTDDLACPVCFAQLRFLDSSALCTGCARSFPIVDGIPVLIAERANDQTS